MGRCRPRARVERGPKCRDRFPDSCVPCVRYAVKEHLDPADLAELALEGRAVDEAPPRVREHLCTCGDCRGELDMLRRLVGAARSATPSDLVGPPPPGVWDRLAAQARVGRPGRPGRRGRAGRAVRLARLARMAWVARAVRAVRERRAGRASATDADEAPGSGGRIRRRDRLTGAVLLLAGLAVAAARCAARYRRRRRSVREDPLRRRA
ncbi:hypothetical protein DDW44_25205 [Streptomyces tirandamycinicus]|uniref:Zinc-finger domain-containing protein n=1 Tax=Streptomyces tirandamycinicus TaxID=2174846 RepID=A0A2S1SZ73_9ACTN|nr:hypothetical protein DDW44_25205 [Streptomyces tirandamycinicus]